MLLWLFWMNLYDVANLKMIIINALKGATRGGACCCCCCCCCCFYNLLTAPGTVSKTHAQVARAQSCANQVQDIGRLSRVIRRVPRGTKGQLSC